MRVSSLGYSVKIRKIIRIIKYCNEFLIAVKIFHNQRQPRIIDPLSPSKI